MPDPENSTITLEKWSMEKHETEGDTDHHDMFNWERRGKPSWMPQYEALCRGDKVHRVLQLGLILRGFCVNS